MERESRKRNELPIIDKRTRTSLFFESLNGANPLNNNSVLLLNFGSVNTDFENLLTEPAIFIMKNKNNSPVAYYLGIISVLEPFSRTKKNLIMDLEMLDDLELFHATEIFKESFYGTKHDVKFEGISHSQKRLLSYLQSVLTNNPGIKNAEDEKDFSNGTVATYKMLKFLWPRLYPKG